MFWRGGARSETTLRHTCARTLYFPSTSEHVDAANEERADHNPPGRENILLIEDEHGVRRLTGRLLRRDGYTVVSTPSSTKALAHLDAPDTRVDLIITDVVLPQMSGPSLIQAARTKRPDIPVIFVSGHTDGSLKCERHLDGTTMFIQKPFSSGQLLRTIRRVLSVAPDRSPGQSASLQHAV